MVLFMIGLGLSDEKDITVKGLEAVKCSSKVYLEMYTAILMISKQKLEDFFEKEVIEADREFVESGCEVMIQQAKTENIAFLVVGDPFCATTHSDLYLRCIEEGVKVEVIHNASIVSAVGCSGLQVYRFGEIVSLPFFTEKWRPYSFYDKIKNNREKGLHTLVLLDIKVKEPTEESLARGKKVYMEPRYMRTHQAAEQIIEAEQQKQEKVYELFTPCFGLARIGTSTQQIISGTLEQFLKIDMGEPLHSFIICGEMHHIEEDMDKAKLENEIKTLIGINYNNIREKQVQTDFTYSGQNDGQDTNNDSQQIIKKLQEDLQQIKRNNQEIQNKNDYLSDRIVELEQDIQIRDKALAKLTQGNQMAEVIGNIKDKIREDLSHKFNSFKTRIGYLEGVIDTNSKLIKDLSESIQEKNLVNQTLINEDKLKQGKIENLTNKVVTVEKQQIEWQKQETQMRILIEKLILEKERKTNDEIRINLPDIQLSTEQIMIKELQEQLIYMKVENLKIEEENRKNENRFKKSEVQINEIQTELERYKSMIDYPSSNQYVLKQIQANPKSIDLTIQKINEALQYIDRNITRHNFKEELLNYYEDKLIKLGDNYEMLLLQYFEQQSHLQMNKTQLEQYKLMLNGQANNQTELTGLIQQQWLQSEKHLKRIEDFGKEQFQENKKLKIRLQEMEEKLLKYKKFVMFDHTQYERMYQIKNEVPFSQSELGVIQLFLNNSQVNEFQRINRILDVVLKNNLDLEYELYKNSDEKLRNEYHLIIEQREMELKQRKIEQIHDEKIRKLEFKINQIENEFQVLENLNKEGNPAQAMLKESTNILNYITDLLNQGDFTRADHNAQQIKKGPQNSSGGHFGKQSPRSTSQTQNQTHSNLNTTQDKIQQDSKAPPKKKVQVTNLLPSNDGRKPRVFNDYNKQLKPQEPKKGFDLEQLVILVKELQMKISKGENILEQEQKIRARQAADSLKEMAILKETLMNRQQENLDLINDLKKILLTKNELTNQLILKDYQLYGEKSITQSNKTSPRSSSQKLPQDKISKLEGLIKVNNFVRKKELEAREESELYKHKHDKLNKERLSLTLDNKKLTEQIRYLQQLLKNQREQFRKGQITNDNNEIENAEIPEDDIVRFLIQIDELNQRNSELEYILQQALQSNIEKEKLMRGTEELVEYINTKIEQISLLINSQIPQRREPDRPKFPKMPEYIGPESVFERISILGQYVVYWFGQVQEQITNMQQQKQIIENLKPNNQTLTQAEHQAKLEKYLNIYSARIQTLSSIIASYQRHFKMLEEQIRDLQGIPNIAAMQQLSMKQIENSRIESLKRMINLKDILIKHQQNEIEYIKKAIISDKFNDNLIYVTPQEKEALKQMRTFDTQIKVIQDYERQMLLVKEEENVKKGEEHIYLKQVNAKIQQDLLNIKEVFETKAEKSKQQEANNKSNQSQQQQANIDKNEYIQKWLKMIQDLLQSQFDVDKCKFYVQTLNQEIPIILSIMTQNNQCENSILATDQQSSSSQSLEVAYLEQKIAELKDEQENINKQLQKFKDRCNFLRSKNQQLQEQNILLKKFLHTKKALADDFKRFYKQDLLQENEFLRSQILQLTPYNEKLALEVGTLKNQVNELNQKILKQDERHLTEQELFQNLEQTLLDTQKKLIEKDSEVVKMIKNYKEILFKGNNDKTLDLLIETADALNQETMKLREQNWQLAQSLKQKRITLEQKIAKIKESKNILQSYEDKIRELTIENEKLKAMRNYSLEVPLSILGVEKESINKDKLIYELGKDGANTVIKFLDEIQHYKDQTNRIVQEIQDLKVKNTTLMLLAQDKSNKLQQNDSLIRFLRKENKEQAESIEKLEYLNQKLNDDYIVQQQALDVYMEIAIPIIGKNQIKAFSKCLDNAKLLQQMLQELQKQRNHYYETAIYYERQAYLLNEQVKVIKHEQSYLQQQIDVQNSVILNQNLQQQIISGIISKYEKEMSIINKMVQENSTGIEFLIPQINDAQQQQLQLQNTESPQKQVKKEISVIDSPPLQKKQIPQNKGPIEQAKIFQNQQQIKYIFNERTSSIHLLLNTQLQINKLKANQTKQTAQIQTLRQSQQNTQVLLQFYKVTNSELLLKNHSLVGANFQWIQVNNNLKLQNINLSRQCLYSYRANTLVFKRNDQDDQEQVEKLMSQEIDKLKIENRMVQERNEMLEQKLDRLQNQEVIEENKDIVKMALQKQQAWLRDKQRIELLERELQQQIEWNTQLEQEILSKSAQIDALSKIHNDFSTYKAIPSLIVAQPQSDKASNYSQQDDGIVIQLQNLRIEYSNLESKSQQLHEKIYLLENKNHQKEQKIEMLSNKIRDLEKQLIDFKDKEDHDQQIAKPSRTYQINSIVQEDQKTEFYISEKEASLRNDVDEIWSKFRELNDLKNRLYERNDDLKVEIDSFKTHFSKYEAQEFKKKMQGQDSFQYQLYNELTLLREERDLSIWQLNKQTQRIFEQQSKIEVFREIIPQFESQINSFEEKEISYLKEVSNLKEQLLQSSSKDFDQIKTLLKLFEGNRLRRDKVTLVYENARLRRENDSLRKEVSQSKQLQDKIINREFQIKKRVVELKNELVKLRVTYDMGEYQTLITGKSPLKTTSKKQQEEQEYKQSIEKVKQYVEDLAVLRENLLKIEFRNIEMEELFTKKDRDIEELKQNIKDLQQQLTIYEDQDTKEPVNSNKFELDNYTRQVVDLQQRVMEEKWNSQKLQTKVDQYELQIQELRIIQEKYLEEVREHQKLNMQITIMQKQIVDLQKPHQQLGIQEFQENSDIVFYDQLKEKFLMQLGLYIDEIRWKNKQIQQGQEKYRVLQDQMIRLSIQFETFEKERQGYKLLIDNIISQKINSIEEEFVNTAQHEEGLSKLEVHIMNQRKKLAQLKAQLDTNRNEKDILEQNLKAMHEVVRNLEKHSMEYNSELTEAKDELIKLRGERERYEQRVGFMWERLDFQQRLHHKVKTNNNTLELVIKVYKEEINKLKAFLHLNAGGFKKNDLEKELNGRSQEITKSHVIQLENEITKLKNKDKKQEEHIERMFQDNENLKLYTNLSDMLRRIVGISQQEREQLESKIAKKRSKLRDFQFKYVKESKEREQFKERTEFLEKQIVELRQGQTNPLNNFVKANTLSEEGDDVLFDPKEVARLNHHLKQQVKEFEAQNIGLRQQIAELNGQISNLQHSFNKASDKRSIRAVTPVRIRDMQIKNVSSGNISQRLNNLRQDYTANNNNQGANDFYYGQHLTLDPLQHLQDDINDAIMERQSQLTSVQNGTKLPMIGNQYYQQNLDQSYTQTNFDKRNLTPLQARMKATTYTSLGGANDQTNLPPKPLLESKNINYKPIMNNKGGVGFGNRNNSMVNRTVVPVDDQQYDAQIFPNNNNSGVQLSHQGSSSVTQNSFMFKNL